MTTDTEKKQPNINSFRKIKTRHIPARVIRRIIV